MGGGGISLPVSMSFPISREGLAHAVKPKGVTLIGEIKDNAIRGESAGKPDLMFQITWWVWRGGLAKILQLLVTEPSM